MDQDTRDEMLLRIDRRLEALEKRIDQWEQLTAAFMAGPGRKLARMLGVK